MKYKFIYTDPRRIYEPEDWTPEQISRMQKELRLFNIKGLLRDITYQCLIPALGIGLVVGSLSMLLH